MTHAYVPLPLTPLSHIPTDKSVGAGSVQSHIKVDQKGGAIPLYHAADVVIARGSSEACVAVCCSVFRFVAVCREQEKEGEGERGPGIRKRNATHLHICVYIHLYKLKHVRDWTVRIFFPSNKNNARSNPRAWHWCGTGMTQACMSIAGNRGLKRRVDVVAQC